MQIWSKILLGQERETNYITQIAVTTNRLTLHSSSSEFKNIQVSCATTQTSIGYVHIYLTDTSIYQPFCYNHNGNLLTISGNPGGARYAINIKPTGLEVGVIYTLHGGIVTVDNPDYEHPLQRFTIQYIISDDTNPFGG